VREGHAAVQIDSCRKRETSPTATALCSTSSCNNKAQSPHRTKFSGGCSPRPKEVCYTMPHTNFASAQAEVEAMDLRDIVTNQTTAHRCGGKNQAFQLECSSQPKQQIRRLNTPCLSATASPGITVSVVAPGAGTSINSQVYAALGQNDGFSVNIIGQSRAQYDRYPASWGSAGSPPPNLETFAMQLLAENQLKDTKCVVVGSRGGQVVLPALWHAQGADVPPAIVINGGCAMDLPIQVRWPVSALTFLLLGGDDYFRGPLTMVEYLTDVQRRIPSANVGTAILLVHEMTHMPQAHLLAAILHSAVCAMTSWKSSGNLPWHDFRTIITGLRKGGWSGKLSFKTAPGDNWETHSFP